MRLNRLAILVAAMLLGPVSGGGHALAEEWPAAVELAAFQGGPPPQSYVDFDQLSGAPLPAADSGFWDTQSWVPDDWQSRDWEGSWQILPAGLIFENYLAGVKESRMSAHFIHETDDEWLVDATIGGHVGLIRWGSTDPVRPVGVQLDVEGSAQVRLDPLEDRDLRSVDCRGGIPISFGSGRHRWKFGYYHLSSHVGDEFLLKNPTFARINYSRDVLILAHAVYLTPTTRIYAEAGWAMYSDVSEPWEFQFGIDRAPVQPTGLRGSPFWAINGQLRQEVDFGGSVVAQAGWAWRSDVGSPLLRAGFHYLNGKSSQFEFYNQHEQQLGMALWYDF